MKFGPFVITRVRSRLNVYFERSRHPLQRFWSRVELLSLGFGE